mgnify:CR=1 FL=1
MAGRQRYAILRPDGLLLHTKPVTKEEAWWLEDAYSAWFLGRDLRIKYLSEWGNVLDVKDYLERLEQHGIIIIDGRIYGDPARFVEELRLLYYDSQLGAGAKRVAKELLDRVEGFMREPVRPTPIAAPVRYLETPYLHFGHVSGPSGTVQRVRPRPEWLAHRENRGLDRYGISVFEGSFWLWWQHGAKTRAIVVRRGADDGEVISAVASDGAVLGFLKWFLAENGDAFRDIIDEHEAEMVGRGYGDVARKAKIVLATYKLLNAGRSEEGEKGVPA